MTFCLSVAILATSLAFAITMPRATSLAQTAEAFNSQDKLADLVAADEVISASDRRISSFEVSQYASGSGYRLTANVTLVDACAQPGDTVESWMVVKRTNGAILLSRKAEYTLGAIYDDFINQHSWTDCHFSLPPSDSDSRVTEQDYVRGALVVILRGRKLAFTLPEVKVLNASPSQ
jgi:hypothetical protein